MIILIILSLKIYQMRKEKTEISKIKFELFILYKQGCKIENGYYIVSEINDVLQRGFL